MNAKWLTNACLVMVVLIAVLTLLSSVVALVFFDQFTEFFLKLVEMAGQL